MFRICFALCMFLLPSAQAQENVAEESKELSPLEATMEAQKQDIQATMDRNVGNSVKKMEPQQLKKVISASELITKNNLRRANRALPPEKQIQFQKKEVNINNTADVTTYLNDIYLGQTSEAAPTD